MTRFHVQTYQGAVAMIRRGVRLDGPWIASLLRLEAGRPMPAEFVEFLAAPFEGTQSIYRGDPKFRRFVRKYHRDAAIESVYRELYAKLKEEVTAQSSRESGKRRRQPPTDDRSLSVRAAEQTVEHLRLNLSAGTILNLVSRTN